MGKPRKTRDWTPDMLAALLAQLEALGIAAGAEDGAAAGPMDGADDPDGADWATWTRAVRDLYRRLSAIEAGVEALHRSPTPVPGHTRNDGTRE